MKLLVGIKCWWQGDWIEYVLRSVYDIADYIQIAHGPVKVMAEAGFTNDDTMEKIKKFPDPKGKITLIDKEIWNGIEDMSNATINREADFYMKLDGDEVPSPEWIQEFWMLMLESKRTGLPITSNYWHCVKDFKHIIDDAVINEWRLRGFPITEDVVFNHPDSLNTATKLPIEPSLRMKRRLHHYNWIRSLNAVMVHRAYQLLNWKDWTLEQVKKATLFEPDFERGKIQNALTEWSMKKEAVVHPELVQTHPFWPDGPDWSKPMDWSEVLRETQS